MKKKKKTIKVKNKEPSKVNKIKKNFVFRQDSLDKAIHMVSLNNVYFNVDF